MLNEVCINVPVIQLLKSIHEVLLSSSAVFCQRGEAKQDCLFRAQLVFTPLGGLAVDPILPLFQDMVQKALLGLSNTILQVTNSPSQHRTGSLLDLEKSSSV